MDRGCNAEGVVDAGIFKDLQSGNRKAQVEQNQMVYIVGVDEDGGEIAAAADAVA